MNERLSWSEIRNRYDGEWIELVDFDWDDSEPDPTAGVIRVHSKDRKEFDKLISQGREKESAILYVGKLLDFPEGHFFNANQHQYFSNK